ncbi:MAG: hypothetical protein HN337_00910 [Deltaproteobacteria bacterium]|nr:hypothetical protein [Deltaproteobacteria bacterium]
MNVFSPIGKGNIFATAVNPPTVQTLQSGALSTTAFHLHMTAPVRTVSLSTPIHFKPLQTLVRHNTQFVPDPKLSRDLANKVYEGMRELLPDLKRLYFRDGEWIVETEGLRSISVEALRVTRHTSGLRPYSWTV